MAMANATCICKICGATFKKSKKCMNRAEAENYQEWAEENFIECPDCYRERIKNENDDKLKAMEGEVSFPAIEGVSDKQINYAIALRNKFTVAQSREIKMIYNALNNPEFLKEVSKRAATENVSEKDYLINFFKKEGYYMNKAYVALTETKANKIINEFI